MRRVVPWLATVLVGVGAAGGAVLASVGLPGQSPSAWARQLLTRTEAAGTARFSGFLRIVDLNGEGSASGRVSGQVDFASDRARTVWASPPGQPGLVEVHIGDRVYMSGDQRPHVVSLVPRRDATAVDGVLGNLAALATPARVWAVRRLGAGRVGGAPATHFQVDVRPTCAIGPGSVTTVDVWVDASGRLVEATARDRLAVATPRPPAGTGSTGRRVPSPTGSQTLRLADFGTPVRIVAPASLRGAAAASSSVTVDLSCGQ